MKYLFSIGFLGLFGIASAEEQEPARVAMTKPQLEQFAWKYYSAGINETVKQFIEKCTGAENAEITLTADDLQYTIVCRSASF